MSGVALGITSAAISLGGATASFIQAGQRSKDIREAEAAANAAMEAARKRTEVNYMEQLGIQKDAYRQAYEANLVTSKALSDAAIEGDQRGGGAAASRILAGSLDQADRVRAAQEGEMVARDQAIATENQRLNDINIQLDLEEVAGAQQQIADAELAKGMAIQEGISGLSDAAMAGAETVPLYMKKRGAGDAKNLTHGMKVNKLTGKGKVVTQGSRRDKQAFKQNVAKGELDIALQAQKMGLNDPNRNPFAALESPKPTGANEKYINKQQPLFKKDLPQMSSVITNKKQGDAFREYVVSKHPEYAKKMYSDGLSKSGSFDNKYIKKAYDDYGLEYLNFQRGY
jgi:hypothetical protein|tara:strand:+ start:11689 stop:12714 length:1026 start_codon:yes stop_codon:yes gene_type:complete